MARRVLTVGDLEAIPAGGEVVVPTGTIITPLASDEAALRGITIRFEQPKTNEAGGAEGAGSKKIAIGADHGGFDLKEELRNYLREWGYAVLDLGTSGREAVDYPDFAEAVANAVASGDAWRGVVIDTAGIGSSIAANKVPGARAALCYDRASARNSREHNDANILSLARFRRKWRARFWPFGWRRLLPAGGISGASTRLSRSRSGMGVHERKQMANLVPQRLKPLVLWGVSRHG
jgi:ribose 5-phosphate isomerase B